MSKVCRKLVLPRGKRPFFEWAKIACNSKASLAPEDIRPDCSAWQLPVDGNLEAFLRERFDEIFRRELLSITGDQKMFPAGRTLEMFRDWFEVDVHAVYDLDG